VTVRREHCGEGRAGYPGRLPRLALARTCATLALFSVGFCIIISNYEGSFAIIGMLVMNGWPISSFLYKFHARHFHLSIL
jgi:uncharacterized membrane protein YjjB (DUF3815 family)